MRNIKSPSQRRETAANNTTAMSNKIQNQEKHELPVKFSVIPETLQSPFKELFPAYTEGLVKGEPGDFVYHPLYGANADKFYNFPIRKDDVWIRTFPRSGKDLKFCRKMAIILISWHDTGTTWTSELAWLIMNDCNFEAANTIPLTVRSPNIE